jgi:RES domain-containing protein
MELFRISLEKHANKLAASRRPNRWNKKDEYVLYTGSSRSLSSLELVVHRSSIQPLKSYKVMVISVADYDGLINQVKTKDLSDDWRSVTAYPLLQAIGSDWYHTRASLLLKVPSAVIPQEFNYVININHPDFQDNVTLIRTENYFWDDRLL